MIRKKKNQIRKKSTKIKKKETGFKGKRPLLESNRYRLAKVVLVS
ncbi:hypothetical protein GPEL0_01r0926 [Geoanaerobacter pelophilus]|uniref:Uncharacterized protein n=1 Tax=Geoanaerobacter pelophilus TaxID=60036 RepID=A0ABQ0MFR9_9BACT|nr:hypothetical protein GPEL0_01r0926 [Geoanaerobacter pelophilus]